MLVQKNSSFWICFECPSKGIPFSPGFNRLWCLYFNTNRKETRPNNRSNVCFITLNKSISYKQPNLVPQQLKIKNIPDWAFWMEMRFPHLLHYQSFTYVALLFSRLSESEKSLSHARIFVTPWAVYSPWNSPGQNTGVGNLSLHQGVFPAQGSNPGLPPCKWILYWLSHKGSPYLTILSSYFSIYFPPISWPFVQDICLYSQNYMF